MPDTSLLPRPRRAAFRHPSGWLLAVQLLSLLLYAQMGDVDTQDRRVLFSAIALVVVPLAVWVVRRGPAANWIAWLLAAPAIVLSVLAIVLDRPALIVWSSMLEAALYFYAAGSLIAYMLHDHVVTTDELYAVGATFTLVAWAFAYAYLACQAWYPGSFAGEVEPERPRVWLELLFLSVSTLAGVGNGDILPLSPQARVLVMFEHMAGVGYVGIVVSRMVGLSVARHRG
ncbi:MAG TPA: ion channel [Lysobacter sp.]